jgi:hypothetical protein
VTVLPDAGPAPRVPGDRNHHGSEPSLARWAELGRGKRATPVHHVTVLARDPELVSAGLRALPPQLGDFVVQRGAAAARPAGSPRQAQPIRTSAAAAAAVAAALLNVLRLRHRSVRGCGVVIAGAATMPALCPMLVDAGLGGVATWDGPRADLPPLHRLTRHADAVVDLSGHTWELARAASIPPDIVVLTPAPRWALLVLPGLIRAVAGGPPAELGPAVHHACAVALASAAPPGRALPDARDPAVSETVARAAAAVLRQAARPQAHATAAARDGART